MQPDVFTEGVDVGLVCKVLPGPSVPRSDPKHQGEPCRPGFEKSPPLSPPSKIGQRNKEVGHLCGAKWQLRKGGLAWHVSGACLNSCRPCGSIWVEAGGTQTMAGQSEGAIHGISTLEHV